MSEENPAVGISNGINLLSESIGGVRRLRVYGHRK